MSRDGERANDVHVRVGRLVVDRAALVETGVRDLPDTVAARIAQRLEGVDASHHSESASSTDLSDVIATAVAARVSPRMTLARRR